MIKGDTTMKRKLVSVITAVVMSAALTVPALAASPTTADVINTPVSVPTEVAVAKGYELSEAESAAVATTPAQAIELTEGVTADIGIALPDGVVFGSVPAQPADIAMAKADLLKNAELQAALAKLGIGVNGAEASILKAGQLVFSNAVSGEFTVGLAAEGITSARNVAILVYVPGELKPRVIRPIWRNGKLQAKLPVPCSYSIVSNERKAVAPTLQAEDSRTAGTETAAGLKAGE